MVLEELGSGSLTPGSGSFTQSIRPKVVRNDFGSWSVLTDPRLSILSRVPEEGTTGSCSRCEPNILENPRPVSGTGVTP